MTLVAIMRPNDKLKESKELAEGMGFEVVCASPIEIEVNPSPAFDLFLHSLREGASPVVIFTSSAGVKASIEIARRLRADDELRRLLSLLTVVAIGPATARGLEREGIRAAFMPDEFTSRGILASSEGWGKKEGECYILRSDRGSGDLIPGLQAAGFVVQEIIVYILRQRAESEDLAQLIEQGRHGKIDFFLFSSSLSARTFIESWAERDGLAAAVGAVNSARVVAIGPPTRQALESLGVRVDIMPKHATLEAMLLSVRESATRRDSDSG